MKFLVPQADEMRWRTNFENEDGPAVTRRVVKFTEFVRKAPGKFDVRVMSEVEAAMKQ